jgi:lipopolysaccharide export system protein LptA
VQKIIAQTNAHLQAVSDASETSVAAHHVEMNFEAKDGESTLSTVSGSGNAVVTSKPVPAPKRQPGETHVLRSSIVEMKMRPGGKEIENVVVPGAGELEFLPNLPVQHHRTLHGDAMNIGYGPENRVQSFRANAVRTRTDPTADERKRNPKRVASITTSRTMSAEFDPKTGRLQSMEQAGDFTFDEGDRKARAAKATLDAQDVMFLETGASLSDSTGATSADRIRIDQRTGNLKAEGGVRSSKLPDKNPNKKSSEMLSSDEPLLAQAGKMETSNDNRKVRYDGGALMWQGANRIQAETIDLDRDKRILIADGKVVTNLWEGPKPGPKEDPKKKAAAPLLTEVRAARMVYTELDRLALYTGGTTMNRAGLNVKSQELRAWLADSPGDSRLLKAFADGAVEIVQQVPPRTRTGSAGHAEFYTEDQKIVLREGRPKMVDINGNQTEGDELTYYANDARLLVNGSPAQPAASRIKATGKKK